MILKRKSVIQVTIYIRYSKIKPKVCSGSVGERLTWGRWSEPHLMQYVLSLSKTINLVLSTGSTQETPRHDWKVVDKEKVSTKKNKKHHIKKIQIKKSKIKKKSANEIMHQSGKINFIMICQKGVPQKKRDPTKFNIKQQTLFHWVCSWELPMESTSAFQGPQHGSHIGQKTLIILMKKSNNNIY